MSSGENVAAKSRTKVWCVELSFLSIMALWSSYCLALFSSPLVLFWAIITPKKLSTSFTGFDRVTERYFL
jgi:hypothetical protein